MKKYISPSVMCADFVNLGSALDAFVKAKIEYLHVDIMDGAFVPNYTLGPDFCKCLKKHCSIPLDVHLMVERPEDKIDMFPVGEGDIVSVHFESTPHAHRAVKRIIDKGAAAYLAINPATPLSALDYLVEDISGVLVMTVDPGFAGQKLVPATLKKIADVRKKLDDAGRSDALIEVDGNVSFENARKMSEMGANIFVAGTSSVFTDKMPFPDAVRLMREAIER